MVVIGGTEDIAARVKQLEPDELVAALPSLDPAELRRLVALCESTRLPFKVLPRIAEVLEGNIRLNQLRDVRLEDLLGRDPVELSLPELAEDFRDRAVLITGAAGSIGSELSRQVARHGPRRLILLDQAESALYLLELELRRKFPEVELRPVVGDILDRELVESLFAGETPPDLPRRGLQARAAHGGQHPPGGAQQHPRHACPRGCRRPPRL